jgi:hypothetical protein
LSKRGKKWTWFVDKLLAAHAAVVVVVEIRGICAGEGMVRLLNSLELVGIKIPIAVSITDAKDTSDVLLPLITGIGTVVVGIPSRCGDEQDILGSPR